MTTPPFGLDPKVYTLSALILGYLMIGDYTANEQNAIGNWFMTIGQILETNSAFQQYLEDAVQGNTININSRQFRNGGSPYMDNPALTNFLSPDDEEIKKIKEMLQKMIERLDNLEKK